MLNLEGVYQQNPWWKEKSLINQEKEIKTALQSTPQKTYSFEKKNTLLLGARQTGKTTYLKLLIKDLINKNVSPKNILFYSCDSLSTKEDILSLARFFEEQNTEKSEKYLFLDEISFVKDWSVAILSLFNSGYMNNKNVYLSGSSSVSLQKERLPGRVVKKTFNPLSFREYFDLFSKKITSEKPEITKIKEFYENAMQIMPYVKELNGFLHNYIQTGGLLATSYAFYMNKQNPAEEYLEVYQDALLSDVAKLGLNERTFKEVIGNIIIKYSTPFSANSVTSNSTIKSNKTVQEYMDLMEKMFITRTIYKTQNNRVMYRSNKKTYITDPFFYQVLKNYSLGVKEIKMEEKPKILEGVVGEALVRKKQSVYFAQTKTGKETDFIYENIGMEVKQGNPDFIEFNEKKGFLLSKDKIELKEHKAIIPCSVFLYLIG